ncbi:hypothetical protein AC792_02065 [Arthrobacter sp. RIT-PI-e]|uniref:NUDIX hydrolase n=1 Tax=Arthrobacter sp. RIT-PI-e TaxID=1681197 RepID=UPI0006763858|nr:NUDIX domain-containing protein [Arthrobacter sp. RIT-PI-e]KNC20265.1 hypothetical protein AC792_02065 [Arthrobacter sp. RIT-PI-e]
MPDRQLITVTALCLLDPLHRLLLVRKRGTAVFMQPGGKPEPGESPAATGVRELFEELGLVVAPEDLVPLGTWTGRAANEADARLHATVFLCPLTAPPEPRAEIEEIDWLELDRTSRREDLAPLLTEFVVPLLRVRSGDPGPSCRDS